MRIHLPAPSPRLHDLRHARPTATIHRSPGDGRLGLPRPWDVHPRHLDSPLRLCGGRTDSHRLARNAEERPSIFAAQHAGDCDPIACRDPIEHGSPVLHAKELAGRGACHPDGPLRIQADSVRDGPIGERRKDTPTREASVRSDVERRNPGRVRVPLRQAHRPQGGWAATFNFQLATFNSPSGDPELGQDSRRVRPDLADRRGRRSAKVREKRTLGRTGFQVSDIGFGTGSLNNPAVLAVALDRLRHRSEN